MRLSDRAISLAEEIPVDFCLLETLNFVLDHRRLVYYYLGAFLYRLQVAILVGQLFLRLDFQILLLDFLLVELVELLPQFRLVDCGLIRAIAVLLSLVCHVEAP